MAMQRGVHLQIDWKIKNFDDLPSKKGLLLSSPTFVIDTLYNSQWVLHLYPRGDNDGNGKSTALYLVRQSDDDYSGGIILDCELSLIPEKMTSLLRNISPVSWKATDHVFQKGSRCGSQEFLEKEKLSSYLENNTLTVHGKIFHYNVDASSTGGCEAVSVIGIDQRSFDWIIEDFQDFQPGHKKVTPIKTAWKDASPMTMTLTMTSENILMVDISPVDGKRIKHAYCYLVTKDGPESVWIAADTVWYDEMKSDQNWSFSISVSKEYLLDKLTDNSLYLQCNFRFKLGIESEKVENTYYRPLSDLKNDSCNIM